MIASRSFSKVEPVIQTIKSTDRSIKTSFVQVDLSDHVSVRKAAAEILEAAPGIDVLIKSVGNMAIKDYTLDKRAIEMQVSVNHVGYFPLTNLLVPALRAAATRSDGKGARVVNLTARVGPGHGLDLGQVGPRQVPGQRRIVVVARTPSTAGTRRRRRSCGRRGARG